MKKIGFAIAIMCCFMSMRCEPTDETPVDLDNLLIGNWSHPEYAGDSITLQRVNVLPENSYGLKFKTKGEFEEHTSGWLRTPPLFFSDYSGVYKLMDGVISITQNHFPNNYTLRIVSLTEDELILIRELSDQEQDYRDLMTKFDEILASIEDIPCNNEQDWKFAAYGAKACGGSQGYLAYPKTIDEEKFLKIIGEYTHLEDDYNMKWGVFSTCDLPLQPTAVSCENGLPVLVFN